MKRVFVLVLLLACGNKTETASKGPAYTPALAHELSILAPSCELESFTGSVSEVRKCKGDKASATISLDRNRHVVKIAIELLAWTPKLARERLELSLKSLVSKPALATIGDGLAQPANEGTVDGVTFRSTKGDGDLAHYTLALRW